MKCQVTPLRQKVIDTFRIRNYSPRTVERYTRRDEGRLLTLELTLHDPVMLREPLVYKKVWRYTPDVKFLEHSCETITGRP